MVLHFSYKVKLKDLENICENTTWRNQLAKFQRKTQQTLKQTQQWQKDK